MLIECKLKRLPDGSKIDLFGTLYHFKPESAAPEARHLCEVTDEAAIARFLEIREAYAIARESLAAAAAAPAPAPAPAPVAPPIAPLPTTTTEPPAPAPAPVADKVEETLQEQDKTGGTATDFLIEGDNGQEIDLGKMTRTELVAFAGANNIALPAEKQLKKLDDKAVLELVFKACLED